jgi:hypothetical protein
MRAIVKPRSLLVLVLVVVASSCGGDGVDEEALAGALARTAAAEESSPLAGDEAAAQCFADAVVRSVGGERLAELGMSESNVPDFDEMDLTEAERELVGDALFGCIDVRATMATRLTSQLGEEMATCVAYNLSEQTLRAAVSGSPPEGAAEELDAVAGQCQDAIEGSATE